ncbi:MAG TPA: ABC transporter ATP-binding protein [Candidatus Xenobia bacterium]|jgi:ATP-binding cassette subfamily B protein
MVRPARGVFGYSARALSLVWTTSRPLAVVLASLTLIGALLPAATVSVARWIIDAVVHASSTHAVEDQRQAIRFVLMEAGLVVFAAATQKGSAMCESLLRALLGQRVNVMILEKALTLDLPHFEDSELYDKMSQARRQASTRPLSLVSKTFGLIQNGVTLITYAVLLLRFSPWAVAILVVAGAPAFMVETRFSGEAFRLFRWRSPETRQQSYLETVLAREDYAKEVMLYQLGPLLLQRYRDIFEALFGEDRNLTLRRGLYGYLLGLLSTAAFYGAYVWIVSATVHGTITLGQMTMYLLIFRQGQSAVSAILTSVGGMYEDNLYLSTLYEFLDVPMPIDSGNATVGTVPGDGVRFEHVTFKYPDAERPAVDDVTLHLRPGQKLALVGDNGSGKTTLIKLLTRLYRPQSGRILLDGRALDDWDRDTLRRRCAVIFQDYARYQFIVGENIGAGDAQHFEDEARWQQAGVKGMADPFVRTMPKGYHTQLGRWFRGGHELSGGQWQKIALARAFMRSSADLVVLDEPTAAMDAQAEAFVFEHVKALSESQMAILISHRFSTVRMAEQIVVLREGRIIEQGTHTDLMGLEGHYAHLFSLQAAGYR